MRFWPLLAAILFAGPAYADFVEDSTTHNASANTLTGTEPTGTAQNDLVLALACINASGGTWTDPADFTQIHASDFAAFNCYLGRKVRGSDAGSGYQFTSSSAAAAISLTLVSWRGIDITTPLDVTFVSGSHFNSYTDNVTGAAPAITTATDNATVLLFQHWNGAVSGFALGVPSGYTSRSELLQPGRVNFVVSKVVATAGTETPGVYTTTGTATNQDSVNFTIALKPAADDGSLLLLDY